MESKPLHPEQPASRESAPPSPLPVIEPSPTERTRAKRRLRKWYERRRQTTARFYRTLFMRSGDMNDRTTLNAMGRWLVEETAAKEPRLARRTQRRALLMQRWRDFTRAAFQRKR